MIILFKYCTDVENYESFKDLGYICMYVCIDNNNKKASSLQESCSFSLQVLLSMRNISYNPS